MRQFGTDETAFLAANGRLSTSLTGRKLGIGDAAATRGIRGVLQVRPDPPASLRSMTEGELRPGLCPAG